MEKDLITVVAPAYNHAAYIMDALNSIKNQTYKNKELIVIDDCSKDNTVEVIEKFISSVNAEECFPGGIHFIKHTTNMNAHNTLNEGIAMAKGRYVAIINTDDVYEDNRFTCMMEKLKIQDSRLAFSNVKIINQYGIVKRHEPFEKMLQKIGKFPLLSLILPVENVSISTGNYLFEKSLYEEVGGFDSNYHFIHDWDFVLKSCLINEPVYVENTHYLYRFHETNTIKQIDESYEMLQKKEEEVYSVIYNFLEKISKKEYSNKYIVENEVWTYFLNQKQLCYASSIWNKIQTER